MPDIKKSVYEILVRFTCEKGEKFGEVRGAHQISATYIVNDDGTIEAMTGHVQSDLAVPEIEKILGEKYISFMSQLSDTRKELEEARSVNNELQTSIGEHKANFEKIDAVLSGQKTMLEDYTKQLDDVTADVKAKSERIVELEAANKEMSDRLAEPIGTQYL